MAEGAGEAGGAAGEADGCGNQAQVVVEEKDVPSFAGQVGSGRESEADIRLRERGGIIDAVACHTDFLALRLQVTDGGELVRRQEIGANVVNVSFVRDGSGCGGKVSSEDDGVNVKLLQLGDSGGGGGAELVDGEKDCLRLTVIKQIERGGVLETRRSG